MKKRYLVLFCTLTMFYIANAQTGAKVLASNEKTAVHPESLKKSEYHLNPAQQISNYLDLIEKASHTSIDKVHLLFLKIDTGELEEMDFVEFEKYIDFEITQNLTTFEKKVALYTKEIDQISKTCSCSNTWHKKRYESILKQFKMGFTAAFQSI